jgi:diaminopimelate decarboxylase
VALESADEAAALARAVRATRHEGLRLDVLVRLNPGVEPETLPGLATGARGAKFGVSPDEVGAVVDAGGGPEGPLRWRGIHLHVGSQLGAVDAWRDAVRRGLALVALLRGGLPDFDTLDVGGGLPVAAWTPGAPLPGRDDDAALARRSQLADEAPAAGAAPGPERFATEVAGLLAALPADRRPARLAVEPGRYLVASAGWLLARVLHVRERTLPAAPPRPDRSGSHGLAVLPPGSATEDRTRRLVVVDAGMAELVRPALYGAEHAIVALTSLGRPVDGRAALRPTRVDGPICESTDLLGEHLLPPLRRGDLIAISDAGAYAASMRSAYNGRPRPAEVIVEVGGRSRLLRRRGSLASLG